MSFSLARLLNKQPPHRKLTNAIPFHLKKMEVPNSNPNVSTTFPPTQRFISVKPPPYPCPTQLLQCLPPVHRVATMPSPCYRLPINASPLSTE